MTLRELSQLYWLKKEIKADELRLEELMAVAYAPSGPSYSAMPQGKGGIPQSRTANNAIKILELRDILTEKYNRALEEEKRLHTWVLSIPDAYLRMIFEYRFIDNYSWTKVAMKIGGGSTEDNVKKACYRYLKQTEEGQNADR